MKKVLVTGGSGFIGSWVCKELEERGVYPLVLDHYRGTDDWRHSPTFLGDVRDYTAVSEAVAICDGVIHLAGVLGTQETILEPEPSVQTNIYGGLNVFKACEHYNKKCTYIAVGNHWMNNSYSITKTTAERFALMFNRERGTKISVVRAMNAYGPGQKDKPVRKIMPNFILPALSDSELFVYGDGSQIMDMVYVEDVAKVLVESLFQQHGVYDKVFEVGTGVSTTVLSIAQEVISQVGKGRIHHVAMRPGEPENSVVVADVGTLKPLKVDAADFVQLSEGISKTIPYYRGPS